ncbi:hypothetical protein [Nocardioides sp. REDSEA-S30_B4]|jgi:hypothetical protein|uniref:hypothetical protein n=1 Tax=Nocardioides sp. REDSEA-S30_B4 TaxID=1811552 RepID=UPI000ADA56ED|nr:hypothetical protein [Nocardioides sp. REDSEA-S30_B4]
MQSLIILASEAAEAADVDHALSWGIGVITLGILMGLLFALLAFGGGREHS